MFISGGLLFLQLLAILLISGFMVFSHKPSWFGRLPGDVRYEGRRTRVYAPLTSMLLLSLALSLALFLLNAFF